MSTEPFVPADFAVPVGLTGREFRLVPLGPQHNEADYAAWTASIDHIRRTPGFAGGRWPREMPLADNLRDLERHARDFAERRGFTYTVLSSAAGTGPDSGTDTDTDTGDVIGCVYIYPPRDSAPGEAAPGGDPAGGDPASDGPSGSARSRAAVQSWVRADRAALDPVLHDAVLGWLERDWPFDSVEYAPRA